MFGLAKRDEVSNLRPQDMSGNLATASTLIEVHIVRVENDHAIGKMPGGV